MDAIQLSIDRIPSCITKLGLSNFKPTIFQETERQFSFESLPQLEELNIDDNGSTFFLKKRRVLSNSINGLLTNTFKSLDISLCTNLLNRIYVFRNFVLPLDNLTELRITIVRYADEDSVGALGLSVRSSSICRSLESLTVDISYDCGDLSTFWQSFILPLQNLSKLKLSHLNTDLIINEWPPQLKDLSVIYDSWDYFYGNRDTKSCGKLVLHGIPKTSLKYIRLYGEGDITLKDDPDGKDPIIYISFNGEDDTDYIRDYDEIKSDFPDFFEKIDTVKFILEGSWGWYRFENNQPE
ncbi:unnamed protein product [Ambrosiozyma monospora]|uniref:Unnamed protein product n=1 Tax=Ambrosiozyma monospora TaxID=43982 RepID=A0ACB5T9G3_AMBMO|nr:unnamed protein product [Ambrosiozyma monospora]